MTHACCLDGVCDLDKELLVLSGVLASDEDFDWEPAALDLVEVFGCEKTRVRLRDYIMRSGRRWSKPFFWVVRM
jgi:hypothetical protein